MIINLNKNNLDTRPKEDIYNDYITRIEHSKFLSRIIIEENNDVLPTERVYNRYNKEDKLYFKKDLVCDKMVIKLPKKS